MTDESGSKTFLLVAGMLACTTFMSKLAEWQQKGNINSQTKNLETIDNYGKPIVKINSKICVSTFGEFWGEFKYNFNDNPYYVFEVESPVTHPTDYHFVVLVNLVTIFKIFAMSYLLRNEVPNFGGFFKFNKPLKFPRLVSKYRAIWCVLLYVLCTSTENWLTRTGKFVLYAENTVIWSNDMENGALPTDFNAQIIPRLDRIYKN